ncbi:MAG: Unknown protein [uncultured Thiotrichaceae bacterium]|uniref:Lipoprotein n=1 Tax=uncultured Thiotrichaceae bacterium TaxID=298394 RepID=A0A6S6TEG0_9GAMM|nr:MAG: Unknown protein [uncultured Thiotrichaceae bacterium]
MKHYILTTALAIAITGCATTPSTSSVNNILIESTRHSPVAFHNVRVEQHANGKSIVKGDLKRISQKPVHFGHIDYQLLKNGKTIEQGKIAYGSAIKRRLTSRHSPFSIPLTHQWSPEKQQLRLRWDQAQHSGGQ